MVTGEPAATTTTPMPELKAHVAAGGNAGLLVAPARLRRRCDPAAFPFDTTAACEPARGLIGQARAADALAFGLAMKERSFNVYVAGPRGAGRTTAVRTYLEEAARSRPTPPDWLYVHNFDDPSRPRALRLSAGRGRQLRDGLRALVQAARTEIARAFEGEEYVARREAIMSALNRRREESIGKLTARAQEAGFQLQLSPMGIGIIPVLGNRPLSEEEFNGLRPEMRELIDRRRQELDGEVHEFLKTMRAAERETRDALAAQDREVALHAVGGLVDDLAERFSDEPAITAYLATVREGILADIALFRSHPPASGGAPAAPEAADGPEHVQHERAFHKYEVNVVVDNGDTTGAPVVTEPNPTYANLIGRIEREAFFGALVTDFTLIGPGALHRAAGGYLVVHAADLLRTPAAWDALKRCLRAGEVVIEDVTEALGLPGTRSLRPDAIPLDVKVLLIGDGALYELLSALDPDFRELFKVRADFDTEMDWTEANLAVYGCALRSALASDGRPLDRAGMARLVEESARLVGDQRKLSARFGELADLVREADYWAQVEGSAVIGAAHVRRAVEKRLYRSGLVAERLREAVARGVLIVRPTGSAVGEVHGLAVTGAGDTVFGRAERITATVGPGQEGVVDIERRVELGGPIHSKGILILGGYLAGMYAAVRPLALSARLVFEQSYGPVEGDSASLAELLALLSALGDVPLAQGLAVTGSVNQRGEVQAVGGVNEKIEGFFDTCMALGLRAEQGVILPAANVEHLMLRDDVVEAAAAGRFQVYGVRTVDEAIALLTGMAVGPRAAAGQFPPDSFHARVDARLAALADAMRDFASPVRAKHNGASGA